MYYLIAFVSIFAFSMFLTDEVFGRLDLYLYLLTFWAMLLFLKQEREWLIVPLCILCMCIHQGYIFTCANLVVVLLLYRMLTETGQARKKYVTLTVVLLAVMAVLFVYFEFFSHAAGEEIYDQVVAAAKALSEDGKSYNKSVINHEILGKDVFEDEMEMHQINYQEFPVFLVLFLPYILLAIHFFRGLLGSDTGVGKVGFRVMLRGWVQRWKEDKPLPEAAHVLVLLGGAAVVPQMILKVDYGRYVFMTFTYYIFMVMCLIALGDRRLEAQLQKTKEAIKGRTPFPLAVLLYPMFFMPLHDVVISGAAYRVSTWVVGLFSR
jgi:hypothetical protein